MGERRERQLVWHRTRHCEGGACIEVTSDGKNILVRDPSSRQNSHLIVSLGGWREFIYRIQA